MGHGLFPMEQKYWYILILVHLTMGHGLYTIFRIIRLPLTLQCAQNNLEEAAETHKERIAAAPIPLAEHFALVLGRKPNHSRSVGIGAVNQGAKERYRIYARAEAADQRASDAQNQAAALLEKVERLT